MRTERWAYDINGSMGWFWGLMDPNWGVWNLPGRVGGAEEWVRRSQSISGGYRTRCLDQWNLGMHLGDQKQGLAWDQQLA